MFMWVMNSQKMIYDQYQIKAYDDWDIFSMQVTNNFEDNQVISFTSDEIKIKTRDGKIGVYRYYKDSNDNQWLRLSTNGGYEPKVRDVKGIHVKAFPDNNILLITELLDGRKYQLLLPKQEKLEGNHDE